MYFPFTIRWIPIRYPNSSGLPGQEKKKKKSGDQKEKSMKLDPFLHMLLDHFLVHC